MSLPPKIRKVGVEQNEEKITYKPGPASKTGKPRLQNIQKAAEDDENEEEMKMNKRDFLKLLLEKDMTHICFDILSKLDSKSFTNCRLVSHQWKEFIDYQFYETRKGQQWIENRLTYNYFDENFTPGEKRINLQERVITMTADDFSICVFTEGDHYVDIHSYDFHSLKRNWSFNELNDFIEEDSFEELNSYDDFGLVLNKKRLYVFSEKKVANIYIIDNGLLFHKLCDVFLKAEDTICDVIDFDNSILAACCSAGQLIIFDVKNHRRKPKKLYEENIGIDPILRSEDNNLYSASFNNIITGYDMDARNKAHILKLTSPIWHFLVKYPYIFIVLYEESNCLMVFTMEEYKFIKRIEFKSLIYDIDIARNMLFILESEEEKDEFEELSFFLFDEIVAEIADGTHSVKYDKMTTRKIEIRTEDCPIFDSSCILFCESSDNGEETKSIVKRSFWP